MAAKTCQICGKPSGIYPLCPACFKLRDDGEVIQCPDCKKWHYKKEVCDCKKDENKEDKKIQKQTEINQEDKIITINEQNKSKCITCGQKTDGLLFCTQCYHRFKDKQLLFKITACSNVELLDDSYEGRFHCKDGHIVKSKSEREIDNYLFGHNISHAYEKSLPYGASEKETITPDFYLPNYLGENKHVYIEHWGYNENNIHYTKTKKFKTQIYKDLKITLISTFEKTDTSDIDATLDRKLNKNYIKENEINFDI